MNTKYTHITDRAMAEVPSHIGHEGLEYNWDGDRGYLPSSMLRKDFYDDEDQYRQEFQDSHCFPIEPDPDDLAAYWHEMEDF
jgi:hypothetical protein